MNYFDPISAATRYAKGRPDFHSNTIGRIQAFLFPGQRVARALDIACGTGLSTKALLDVADEVYGTDISTAMLSLAHAPDKIRYSVAPAEQQPFDNHFFDLITVSSGVHWFDIDRFLAEVGRLLKPGGWLTIYENHFIAEMEGQDDFKQWFPDVYLKKYPSPPRNNEYDWSAENLQPRGLVFKHEDRFRNQVEMTKEQLILYFTTQSNIISAVEKGDTTYPAVESWLKEQLSPFFESGNEKQVIYYGNWIKYIQRTD